jgi:hypothetical protein
MTFAQSRGWRRGSVAADDGTRNSRAFASSFIQRDVILSNQSQFKKGAPWAV